MSLSNIFDQLLIKPKTAEALQGGDINKAYCIHTEDQRFFLKVNDATQYPGMFSKEADGLNILRSCTSLKVPQVIQVDVSRHYQFLLLEWLEKEKPEKNTQYELGQGIAELHRCSHSHFGFTENNYIGSLTQLNTFYDDWPAFYAECRILPLVKTLADAGQLSSKDIAYAEKFCADVRNVFPKEKPSLLHGDLWSGNYAAISGGKAAIFDPAVYYGHREMDLGMTQLFGGFSNDFYAGYNNIYPVNKDWLNRLQFTQLYPILVHAVLLGGHYVNNARGIMRLL